jgi:hypothetical protein
MTETLSPSPPVVGVIDPSIMGGNALEHPELKIRFSTFEAARGAEKVFSDTFIDGCTDGELKVGNERVNLKGYLDQVEATAKDDEVISDPKAIAGLYLKTSDVLARNLKLFVAPNSDKTKNATRKATIKESKDGFIAGLRSKAPSVAASIKDWCDGKSKPFPIYEMEYYGLEIDGKDVLDMASKPVSDIRPNIEIQRQLGADFIMGYSDARVEERFAGKEQHSAKRIYMNPDAEAAPELFEAVLQAANKAGLSIKLKMLQRATEFAEAHRRRQKGEVRDGFRGDGIVIYTDNRQADEVLGMVLAIAKDKPEAFVGRATSRVPQNVAEGIAVGDSSVQMPGSSLTSHRAKILNHVTTYVKQSGKTG